MGYFSRLALDMAEPITFWADRSCPGDMDSLAFYLEQLHDRLEELDVLRPRDPMSPLHDRWFYEKHLPDLYEIPDTVQGVLAAIHQAETLLEVRKRRAEEHRRFMSAIQNTGATPEGQYVILWAFLPAPEAQKAIR